MHRLIFLLVVLCTAACLFAQQGPPPHHQSPDEPRRHHKPPQPLNAEQIEEAIEVLSQIRPHMAERLREAQKEHPQHVERMIQREYPRLRMFLELKQREPELFELRVLDIKLESQSRSLARKLRAAKEAGEDEQIELLTDELRLTIAEHFEVRQRSRAYEIEMLKRRIASLEAELADRKQDKASLIDRRMEQLLEAREPRRGERDGSSRHREPRGPRGHDDRPPHEDDNPL